MSRNPANDAFAKTSFLFGGNATFIEQLYAQYQRDPSSVDQGWQDFFSTLNDDSIEVVKSAEGPSWQRHDWPLQENGELVSALDSDWSAIHSDLKEKIEKRSDQAGGRRSEDALRAATIDSIRAIMMIRAYRMRGHLDAGASKVILSAPFKISDKAADMPDDAVTTVMGINEDDYIPDTHLLVSSASCSTTCLAYMVKPLLDYFGSHRILSASMVTVHAATGSQVVLDRLPKAGAKDLRKNRSILNNIILTTTGAAKALSLVIPEMKGIGFLAESVRIPTSTGSLIILNLTIQDESIETPINRSLINGIYRKAADGPMSDHLIYTEEQNVSGDIIGMPAAAAIIEGTETHTRTSAIRVDPAMACKALGEAPDQIVCSEITVPVTNVVVYGWYDNELGSYTVMLGDRIVSIAESML